MNIQWIASHTEQVKNIIAAVVSEETAEDFASLKENILTGLDIFIDLLREPVQAATNGEITLERSRGIIPDNIMKKVTSRIEKMATIEEYRRN